VLVSGGVIHFNFLFFDHIPHIIQVNLEVLGFRVVHWIFGYLDGALIVAENVDWSLFLQT
jgi:hypothetical protein